VVATTLDLLHVLAAVANPVFDIFISVRLSSAGIRYFFNYLSGLVAVSVQFCLLCDGFLLAVLDDCLLLDRLAHSSAHAETAGLERLEAAHTVSVRAHHGREASHSASHSTSEKVIIVVESHSKAHASERVSSLPLSTSIRSSEAHASETTSEATSKEVILIIKEVSEGVSSSKEVLKNFIC